MSAARLSDAPPPGARRRAATSDTVFGYRAVTPLLGAGKPKATQGQLTAQRIHFEATCPCRHHRQLFDRLAKLENDRPLPATSASAAMPASRVVGLYFISVLSSL
jgi:hypothetical protein